MATKYCAGVDYRRRETVLHAGEWNKRVSTDVGEKGGENPDRPGSIKIHGNQCLKRICDEVEDSKN